MHAAQDMQARNGYCQKWRRELAEMKADMGVSLPSSSAAYIHVVVQDNCAHALHWRCLEDAAPFAKNAANANTGAQAA